MKYRALLAAFIAICFTFLTACSGEETISDAKVLTYDDIVNTGLANSCPQLKETIRGSIPLDPSQSYVLTDLCIEPNEYFIKEQPTNKRAEATFVPGKVLTRYTSSLDQVYGSLNFTDEGKLHFTEQGGIDFQAITVLIGGGEEFPFLFTVKGFTADSTEPIASINTSTDLVGDYLVPSYRTSNFLDPKARGLTTGYESAVGIVPQGDAEVLELENTKQFVVGKGHMDLLVSKVDNATGEIAGIFEAIQPTDTDMGGKKPAEVKVRGLFYGRIEAAV
ncbi:MAG: photosystem II manganese-stabilizing polypeptide [Prochlorotrichaceae cyanobacterium]|jgi:photosystem II oxygen-evolving enhancer protein 1